ncbi:hypothetical protein LTR78_002748 [Recurvomyces mirabilis]|uniref:Mog1p/PsbP-like protein n=1 Tax=Recurvomyces mirabilis TaxID=574656 RepID=A0AAE0WSY0_9PEZI|nr:hypothetical protein LTR78_002748 [Recurvomyces mirabilis]KAK5159517.1 hypothetical protein LTS14_002659 [Recurvomyces mirabilis]
MATNTTQPQDQYKPAPLFGGAITCLLPSTFADVSDIRQVPDNQEVWLDTDGFTSIVLDILERVYAKSDADALRVHLEHIVDEDKDKMKILQEGEVAVCEMMGSSTPCYTLIVTSPPGAKQRGRANEPAFVDLLVTLIRLEKQKTDLVVTINVPHVPGTYDAGEIDREAGRLGKLLDRALEMREKVLRSLEIKDFGLFGEE